MCLVNDESIRGAEKTLSALTSVSEERNMNRFKPIVDCIAQTDNLDLWVRENSIRERHRHR